MNIKDRILQTAALYKIGTSQQSKTLPGAFAIDADRPGDDWKQLLALAQASKQTWIVVALGYFGRGANITEAACNCHKAGAAKSDRVSVVVVIGDDDARFESVFSISTLPGATIQFVGSFPNLSCLIRTKQPKQK